MYKAGDEFWTIQSTCVPSMNMWLKLAFMQIKSPWKGTLSPTMFLSSLVESGGQNYTVANMYMFDETVGHFGIIICCPLIMLEFQNLGLIVVILYYWNPYGNKRSCRGRVERWSGLSDVVYESFEWNAIGTCGFCST